MHSHVSRPCARRPRTQEPPAALVRTSLYESALNSLVGFPLAMYCVLYPLMCWRGQGHTLPVHGRTPLAGASVELATPTLTHTVVHVLGCMVIEDSVFYWVWVQGC